MSISLSKITVDGKSLQLKVINQLKSIDIDAQDVTCLGYYNIKNQRKYIFSDNNELFTFVDYSWKKAHNTKTELAGKGNRYKHFKDEHLRENYLSKYIILTDKLNETQLFY